MTSVSYKEREKRRREREILQVARRMLHESGSTDLNMDALAEAVGISKPTLYQHFKSKEDLIVQVLVDGIREVEAYLGSTSDASPLERLKTALRLILVHHYKVDGLVSNFEMELISSTYNAQADVLAAKRLVLAEIDRLAEDGKQRGEIIPTIPTAMIGCLFVKMIGFPVTVQKMMAPEADLRSDSEAFGGVIDNVIGMFERSIAQHPVSD